ncbi:hypothetical protein JQ621_34230 [Bradyrhizobium manausense]|uniref:hypothetical protein n=1 Tax=Bradyrhizobium manausense TaxID=989370 RepID=UPI001BA9660D|nr:hypothetical protein [Bradyrhizobium manausense]MBR1092531.1 hypothetical protein [Bradyrhizobium manausense]
MGQIIQFVSKSERERLRLIQEARAIYDSVFPPNDPAADPSTAANARPGDRGNLA